MVIGIKQRSVNVKLKKVYINRKFTPRPQYSPKNIVDMRMNFGEYASTLHYQKTYEETHHSIKAIEDMIKNHDYKESVS